MKSKTLKSTWRKLYTNKSEYKLLVLSTRYALIFAVVYFGLIFLNVNLDRSYSIADFLPIPHNVQLGSTLGYYFFGILSLGIATAVVGRFKLKNGQLKYKNGRITRFFWYYVTTVALVHFTTWWIIKPRCVRCMSDDGGYSVVLFGVIVPLVLFSASLGVVVFERVNPSKKIKAIKNDIFQFFILYLVLMISSPGYLILSLLIWGFAIFSLFSGEVIDLF